MSTIKVELTLAECNEVLMAIGQMTDGNARDLDEMVLCGMTRTQAHTLIRAEQKLFKARTAFNQPANAE